MHFYDLQDDREAQPQTSPFSLGSGVSLSEAFEDVR